MSLVEVMVSLFVISGGLMAGMNMVSSYAQGETFADQRYIAANLAQALMAEVLSRPHDGVIAFHEECEIRGDSRISFGSIADFNGWCNTNDTANHGYAPIWPDSDRNELNDTNSPSVSLAGYKQTILVEDADGIARITVNIYYHTANSEKKLFELVAYKGAE